MSKIEVARRKRGEVFNALRELNELDKAARYEAKDGLAWDKERMQWFWAVIRYVLKEIEAIRPKKVKL